MAKRHVSAEARIGPELKRLREAAGLSLRTLAERAGFSASFISQVENGVVSPSIASLEQIAATLDVTLGDLFAPSPKHASPVVRTADRRTFRSSWSRASVDALIAGSSGLEALLVSLEPGGSSGRSAGTSAIDQFAMVLGGQAALTLGLEELALRRGDAVLIRAKIPHRWHNAGRTAARILLVSTRRA